MATAVTHPGENVGNSDDEQSLDIDWTRVKPWPIGWDSIPKERKKDKDKQKEKKLYVYRAMRMGPGRKPLIGPTARTLGARPGTDVIVIDGKVNFGGGGISVVIGSPVALPMHRRPIAWGGTGPDPAWKIDVRFLLPLLIYVPDGISAHGEIEPICEMSLESLT